MVKNIQYKEKNKFYKKRLTNNVKRNKITKAFFYKGQVLNALNAMSKCAYPRRTEAL